MDHLEQARVQAVMAQEWAAEYWGRVHPRDSWACSAVPGAWAHGSEASWCLAQSQRSCERDYAWAREAYARYDRLLRAHRECQCTSKAASAARVNGWLVCDRRECGGRIG